MICQPPSRSRESSLVLRTCDKLLQLHRNGRTIEELGRQFEPTEQTVHYWVAQDDRDRGKRKDGLNTTDREQFNQLLRENRRLIDDTEDDFLAVEVGEHRDMQGTAPSRAIPARTNIPASPGFPSSSVTDNRFMPSS